MLSQIHRLNTELPVQFAPITHKNSHCSDCGVFWRFANGVNYSCLNCSINLIEWQLITNNKSNSNLIINHNGIYLNSYINKPIKKQAFRLADTKFVDFQKVKMELANHLQNKKNDNHSHCSNNPLNCKFCQSQNLIFSAGTGNHALRADCKSCGRWYWIQKVIATQLIKSSHISLTQQGKQLSLCGGVK